MFAKVIYVGTWGHLEFALGTFKLKGEDTDCLVEYML